jgi:hypothetical protein
MDVDNDPVHIAHEEDGGQIPNAPDEAKSPIETSVHDSDCYVNRGPCIDHKGPSGSYANIAGEVLL